MTSRKNISAIAKAAKKCNCAVYLKTGVHPPGLMIGECNGDKGEQDLKEWVGSVKVAYPPAFVLQLAILLDGTYVSSSFNGSRYIWHSFNAKILRK